jgi:hypothetical protein
MPDQNVKMNWFLRMFYTLTGGRPMTYDGDGFWDAIGKEKINYWRDAFGRRWMATHGSARFRVMAREQ